MRAKVLELCAQSSCRIKRYVGGCISIEFQGKLALVPSLKNSKLPGFNFTNPDVLSRLIAMTAMYNASPEAATIGTFGTKMLWVTLILGKRPTVFDPDNALASVKDWLEPPMKPGKRKRQWGIGLTDDDRWVRGVALHAKDLGLSDASTRIYVQPWALAAKHVFRLIEGTTPATQTIEDLLNRGEL